MVPLSEHSLNVAELCLPSSQACELEDSEPGNSRPGQRKEGGGEMDGKEEFQGGYGAWGDLASYPLSLSFFMSAVGLIPVHAYCHVQLFIIPWTGACQPTLAGRVGFSKQVLLEWFAVSFSGKSS